MLWVLKRTVSLRPGTEKHMLKLIDKKTYKQFILQKFA